MISEISLELYNTLEKLKNKLHKNRIELIDLSLFPVVTLAKNYLFLERLDEIFVEFLIKLSEAIYLKSCLLLNIYNFEKESFEELKEENFNKSLIEKRFNYFGLLPLERILFDKIFLSRISERALENLDGKRFFGGEEKILILRAILSVLRKEEIKEEILKNFTPHLIEFYLESLKDCLKKRVSFSFREFIKERVTKEENEKFLEVVYYFLSLLFLCRENLCYAVQNNESEDIVIFSRNDTLNR